MTRCPTLVLVAALAAVGGGVGFVESGVYNIGADDHHTAPVLALIERLRERSIGVRAAAVEVPPLEDPARIAAGARHYDQLCAECHLAPGAMKSALRTGLYPRPPAFAQEEARDPQRAFWTIKHGIKMSAMPAWGKTLDDAAVWDVVAFLRRLPALSPQDYAALRQDP